MDWRVVRDTQAHVVWPRGLPSVERENKRGVGRSILNVNLGGTVLYEVWEGVDTRAVFSAISDHAPCCSLRRRPDAVVPPAPQPGVRHRRRRRRARSEAEIRGRARRQVGGAGGWAG